MPKYYKPRFDYNDNVYVFGSTGIVKNSELKDGLWHYNVLIGEILATDIPEVELRRSL